MTHVIRSVALVTGLLALAACSSDMAQQGSGPQPSFYRQLNSSSAKIDAAMAAEMISGYRNNQGRGALQLDSDLMVLAQAKAEAMARADNVAAGSGHLAAGQAENTSAGYLTLAEAFSGWRDSPPHKANMLNPALRRMGVATAYRPGSKYRVFWALVMAP